MQGTASCTCTPHRASYLLEFAAGRAVNGHPDGVALLIEAVEHALDLGGLLPSGRRK